MQVTALGHFQQQGARRLRVTQIEVGNGQFQALLAGTWRPARVIGRRGCARRGVVGMSSLGADTVDAVDGFGTCGIRRRRVLMRVGRQIEHTAELRLPFGMQCVVGHHHFGRHLRYNAIVLQRLGRDHLVAGGCGIVPARQIGHRFGQCHRVLVAQRVGLLVGPHRVLSGGFGDHHVVHFGSGRPRRHRRFLAAVAGIRRRPRGLLGQRIQRGTCRHRCGQAGGIVFLTQRRQRRRLATTQQPGRPRHQQQYRQPQPVPRCRRITSTRRLRQALLRSGQVVVLHRDQRLLLFPEFLQVGHALLQLADLGITGGDVLTRLTQLFVAQHVALAAGSCAGGCARVRGV